MGRPPETKNSSQSLGFTPGSRRGRPSWRGALFLVRDEGVKDQEMLPQKGPLYPPFLSGEIAPHHLPRGKGVVTVCTFSFRHFRFRFGQDAAGEPQSVASCNGVCSCRDKRPHPSGLKKRYKKHLYYEKFFKHQKSTKMNLLYPSTSVSNHKLMNSLV